ncbi:MAG: hypothetical protein ACRD0X_04160, partial [Thermoanaerobaculia bacterium]
AEETAELEGSAEAAGPAAVEDEMAAAQWLAPQEEERLIGELMVTELEEMLAAERAEQGSEQVREQVTEQVRERITEQETEQVTEQVREQETAKGTSWAGQQVEPKAGEEARRRDDREVARRRRSLIRWTTALGALAGLVGLGWILVEGTGGGPRGVAVRSSALASARPPTASASDPSPVTAVPAAPAPAAEPSLTRAVSVAPEPSFTRVVSLSAARQGDATVVTLLLDGAAGPGRWVRERVRDGRPREVIKLLGVASLPQPATLELGDGLVARLRGGLHSGSSGAELHLVADLADPRVRLAGIEAGERSLRLVFLRD